MLRDKPRHAAYRNAIHQNRSMFEGKIILDVGAGTGILSIFCAQAGAKKVFAVEASNIANIARQVVQENDFQSIIDVHQTKIEDFTLPDGIDGVDIIVSEWMGFYLLHEGMLDSVINARDRFLIPGGELFPASATIYIAPCSVPARFDDWSDVDGVRMCSVAKAIRLQKSLNPEILTIPPEHLLHDGTVIAWFDLKEIQLNDVKELTFNEVIAIDRPGRYQGVCIWFDCEFPLDDDCNSIVLSTSPSSPMTHWKQTVVVLPENAHEDLESKDPIALSLTMKPNVDNPRRYNIEVQLLDVDSVEHPIPCDCRLTKCILTKVHLNTMQNDAQMKEV